MPSVEPDKNVFPEEPDFSLLDTAVRVTPTSKIKGLTANDLRTLNTIVSDFSNYRHRLTIPSIDIVFDSGVSGRLVWKSRIGYVFVPDIVSFM